MNLVRVARLRGEERERYVRGCLSQEKIQTLRKYLRESGVANSDEMRKEDIVTELTKTLCQWAEQQELAEVLNRRLL